MPCVDGGQGRLAALANVDPAIPVQRCWVHKIRKVLNKIRQADQEAVEADLHAVVNGDVMLDKSR
ncbi:MAG: transposase [Chloroflexi bacterium]|nr:transposase [Chloroflexota bacterium]